MPETIERSKTTLSQEAQMGWNIIEKTSRASASFLQRKMEIGYNRATGIMEELEDSGLVTKPDHQGKRQILKPASDGPDASRQFAKVALGDEEKAESLTETAREKLRQTVARIERLEEEKAEVSHQIKEVYAEAKAFGYDTKALRKVVSIRKIDRTEREEQEAILGTYLLALGEI